MFKAVISDVELLRNVFSTIGEIVDEVVLKVNKDGISLRAADRAMVAAVDLKLSSKAFDSFEVDEPLNLGINLENLISVLKRASAKDKITLNLKDSQLEVKLENSSKRRFVLPLLEITQEELPQIEQLEFQTRAEVNGEVLESGIEDADIISDAVLFKATPSAFILKAEGDVTQSELTLEKENEGLISLEASEEITARYPLDYLKKMIKARKISDVIKIEFGKDFPLKLTFQAGDKCTLSFVLAPRVIEE